MNRNASKVWRTLAPLFEKTQRVSKDKKRTGQDVKTLREEWDKAFQGPADVRRSLGEALVVFIVQGHAEIDLVELIFGKESEVVPLIEDILDAVAGTEFPDLFFLDSDWREKILANLRARQKNPGDLVTFARRLAWKHDGRDLETDQPGARFAAFDLGWNISRSAAAAQQPATAAEAHDPLESPEHTVPLKALPDAPNPEDDRSTNATQVIGLHQEARDRMDRITTLREQLAKAEEDYAKAAKAREAARMGTFATEKSEAERELREETAQLMKICARIGEIGSTTSAAYSLFPPEDALVETAAASHICELAGAAGLRIRELSSIGFLTDQQYWDRASHMLWAHYNQHDLFDKWKKGEVTDDRFFRTVAASDRSVLRGTSRPSPAAN